MKRPDGSLRFRVIPAEAGMPLRLWVARRIPDIDKQSAVQLIHAGAVYVNHLRVRLGSVRVAAGERITVYPGALEVQAIDPQSLHFIHREEDFVVIHKEAGVPVAPTRQCAVGSLSEALIARLQQEGIQRPYVGILHRLDQGASGLVLFSVRSALNKRLHKHFVDHRIDREYRLICIGHPPSTWSCEADVVEQQNASTYIAAPGEYGAKSARTDFETLRQLENEDHPALSLLAARLHTGRKHQIRVHCAHRGYPILGDRRYAESPEAAAPSARLSSAGSPSGAPSTSPSADQTPSRLYLHAHRLAFEHPLRNEALEFIAPCPAWADPQNPPKQL